jgi:glutathione synthase/RimK-type ligase-like ATP-grasp enzyme
MILVFGSASDPVVCDVRARLGARNLPGVLLEPRPRERPFTLTWSWEDHGLDGAIRADDRSISLSTVRSMFVRQLGVACAAGPGRAPMAQGELDWSLAALLDLHPTLVVNRPAAAASNESKPYQQAMIAGRGFRVPRTLVTNVPDEALRFYDECNGRVIYKSVGNRTSMVRRMTASDRQRVAQLRHCPAQFQEYIPGVEIRVHRFGDQIFATEITSDATDYRYAHVEGVGRLMRPFDLPADIADQCMELADSLGLLVAGLDLRRNPDGAYFCLEVNPTPGFTVYEAYTGQRMGDALVDLLGRAAAPKAGRAAGLDTALAYASPSRWPLRDGGDSGQRELHHDLARSKRSPQ